MLFLKKWENLPESLRNDEVRYYYDKLKEKKVTLFLKRAFDIIFSLVLLILLLPLFFVVAIMVKSTSKGPIFYLQERVTTFGRTFKIIKFRTMVVNADKTGSLVTTDNDIRVTKVGKKLRKLRLDEIPQLINILMGDMSFVGTRPEVLKYVDHYQDYMLATLLMPAGVTSLASIAFKDEEKLLKDAKNVDEVYVKDVLPQKMKYNIEYMEKFNLFYDLKIMIKTVFAVNS
ncbi:MAG: UDP-N-acetylgalactosamine-undecaprenyl-phosphate N-acetylgalactosaminephosphotransferase [Eubacteriales bacterium SKADARSKE-1]|nr:UDP-N-acetylgalactosamine-undecaprenyl-phosphate N-acetylgalactosaminephosphotransferase [Eubacteriales bacterium SKADARSKE-1]